MGPPRKSEGGCKQDTGYGMEVCENSFCGNVSKRGN